MSEQAWRRVVGVALFLLLLCMLILIYMYAREEQPDMRNYISRQELRESNAELIGQIKDTIIQPKDGENGADGTDGDDGHDGANLQTTIIEKNSIFHEIIREQIPIEGLPGKDGRDIETMFNDVTGNVEKRYKGDSFWEILIPCERLKTCGEKS